MHNAQYNLFNQFETPEFTEHISPVPHPLSFITLPYMLLFLPLPQPSFLLSCLLFSPSLSPLPPSLSTSFPFPKLLPSLSPSTFSVYSFPLPYPSSILPCLLLSPSLNSFRQYLPPFPLPISPLLSAHFPFPKLLFFLSPFILSCQLLLFLSPFLPSSLHCPPTFPIPLPSSMSFSFPLPFPVPSPSLSPFLYIPSPSLFFLCLYSLFFFRTPSPSLSLLYPPFHASSTKVMRRD